MYCCVLRLLRGVPGEIIFQALIRLLDLFFMVPGVSCRVVSHTASKLKPAPEVKSLDEIFLSLSLMFVIYVLGR